MPSPNWPENVHDRRKYTQRMAAEFRRASVKRSTKERGGSNICVPAATKRQRGRFVVERTAIMAQRSSCKECGALKLPRSRKSREQRKEWVVPIMNMERNECKECGGLGSGDHGKRDTAESGS
jgi:hypothetical protein